MILAGAGYKKGMSMASTLIITSPTSQFTEMIRSVSDELDFQCIIIEAVLKRARDKTLDCCRENDIAAIISRGGTAEMIRSVTDIPVLEAAANDFDILISLMDAMAISSRIAYVFYANDVIDELPRVTELLKIDVKQYCFKNDAEMLQAIKKSPSGRERGHCQRQRQRAEKMRCIGAAVRPGQHQPQDHYRTHQQGEADSKHQGQGN